MTQFGSLAWASQSRGRMHFGERLAYTLRLLGAQFKSILHKQGADQRALARVHPDQLQVPDSRLAKQALEHCCDLSSSDLVGHCQRAYMWGGLLAQYDGRKVDAEELYVASMLHDLGLTDAYGSNPEIACFAVEGTEAAEAFLKSVAVPDPVRRKITEAVCLHLNDAVPYEIHGLEAHYLHAGTMFDVIGGPRFRQIPREARNQVLACYPRGGMKAMMVNHVQAQMKARPHSRMALLGKVGFGKMVASAPFDS